MFYADLGDNLYEMLNPVFWREKNFKMLPVDFLTNVLIFNRNLSAGIKIS